MSETRASWDALLRQPLPCDHLVQVYSDDSAFVRSVGRYLQSGLENGEAVVVIATPEHRAALTTHLLAIDVALATHFAFIVLDAARSLATFMSHGMPDRAAFRSLIRTIMNQARGGGYEKVRFFGEMVDLLWPDNRPAAMRLEELWREILVEYEVCLLCAYRIRPAGTDAERRLLHQITRYHSHAFEEKDSLFAT
jgi:hypothetical protein